MEAHIGGVARVDTCVHRTEEEVGAIAQADLGVGKSERQSSECTHIWYHEGSSAIQIYNIGIMIDVGRGTEKIRFVSCARRLMVYVCLLTTDKQRSINAPVDC